MCNIRINKADELANPALRVLHSQAEKLHRYAHTGMNATSFFALVSTEALYSQAPAWNEACAGLPNGSQTADQPELSQSCGLTCT